MERCFLLYESAAHILAVAVKPDRHNAADKKKLSRMSRDIIFGSKGGVDLPKVILVENEIDPSDPDQVLWAFATRCHPQNDAHFYTHEKTIPLIHYLHAAEKKDMSTTKVVFDALIEDFDRSTVVSFENNYPEEIKEKVLTNWKKYGYGD